MYLVIDYERNARRPMRLREFKRLRDAVHCMDDALGRPDPDREIRAKAASRQEAEFGVPAILTETHDGERDLFLVRYPATARSKLLFVYDEEHTLQFKAAQSMRQRFRNNGIFGNQHGYQLFISPDSAIRATI